MHSYYGTITKQHFQDFQTAYGDDPNGSSQRTDQGESGRLGCFTREALALSE